MDSLADRNPAGNEAPLDQQLGQLLARVSAGDQGAMEQLYRLCQSRVYRFARSRMNDSFAAADVLHETMIEVWRGASRFEGRSRALTWILGIANHKVMDHLRKQNRHPSQELDESLPDVESPTAEALLEQAQSRTRMLECLSRLSEKHRMVLHLAFYQDLPYGEIAAIVGCPEGTVKTRVFHAKEALKRCLAQKTV